MFLATKKDINILKDGMDRQFKAMEERTNAGFRAAKEGTDKEFKTLRDEMDGRFTKVGIRMMQMEQRLEQRMDKRFDSIEKRISDGIESTRVLFEAIRSDNRAFLEAHQHLNKKVDNHETRIKTLEGLN